jgi:VanZ family protein
MNTRARLETWLPPVVLMALIFFLSAQPDLSSGLGWIDQVGRKIIHAGEYALLCFLWWRALRTVTSARQALTGAFAIAVGYACSDELHQRFVHGRHSSWVDVLIDSLGAGLAVLFIHRSRTAARLS